MTDALRAARRSWRFGEAIATEANRWLALLDAELRLTGNPDRSSLLAVLPEADAVLCRTNGAAMAEAITALKNDQRPAIVGGGGDLRRLAEASQQLRAKGMTTHISYLDRLAPESAADVVISTSHKAKGREWSRVRIGDDFHPPKEEDGEPGEPSSAEMMLAYVATTAGLRRDHPSQDGPGPWIARLDRPVRPGRRP